ncbi:MAG: TetR family transcriptional regulator C-terminal domain-containing protein, partial [Chloroflexi bacterium]|nr:TetR family transcriptional regulator C-terminal domain-containing protein [Chloroflexota bacterium]
AEQMRRIIQLALRQIREDPVVFQVFLHFTAAAPSVPELGDEIRSLWGTFRHITAEGIRAGQRDGSYRSEIDAEAAAAELLGGIVGLALQWMLDPGSFDLDQAGRGLEKHFMADLIAPTPAPGWD